MLGLAMDRPPIFSIVMNFMMGGLAALFLAFGANPVAAQGPYFELMEIVPDDVGADTRWTVSDGHILLQSANGDYSADMTWSPPPRTSDSAGFTVNLNIEGKANPSRIYMGIGISSPTGSFTFDKEPAGADVSVPDAAAGGSESRSNSISVHVTPSTANADGSIIELRVGAYFSYGVTYRYRVSATPVIVTPPQEGPLSVSVECPTEIVIGQLPSLNCHLWISGFRRNTADPVEVLVPAMLDQFGNHANGIQVVDLDGAEDVFNWVAPHSWGFFVYACQAPNIGANCYDNVATPGPAIVPVIVQQKGLQPVNLTLTFNVVGKGGGGVAGAGPLVRIGNRWVVGSFIHIENGTPTNGTILVDWLSARWTLDPVPGAEFVRIHSVWQPEIYLHTENGMLEAGPIQPEWESAMWAFEPVGEADFFRIRNRWRTDEYLNIEAGSLASTPIEPQWLSAMWWLLQ